MSERHDRLSRGHRIAPHLSVVGAIDAGGRDPVYIVWHHRDWCAMCCKLFQKPSQARWEAAALARLAHPGIVRLLEDGSPRYIVTEFLEGRPLRELLRSRPKGRLAAADALRVAVHVGAALAHLHQRGLVHLDVKPANIIVTKRRPVLFDLGSARAIDGPAPRSPQGTDSYMAPEQADGAAPSPASDIWSLGVTLFEMLTGARPFPKGGDAEPFPQLRLAPPPLRQLLPRAPQALEAVVARCLAFDPAQRPPSLAALLPVLDDLIRTGPRMRPAGVAGEENPASPRPADRKVVRSGISAGRRPLSGQRYMG